MVIEMIPHTFSYKVTGVKGTVFVYNVFNLGQALRLAEPKVGKVNGFTKIDAPEGTASRLVTEKELEVAVAAAD